MTKRPAYRRPFHFGNRRRRSFTSEVHIMDDENALALLAQIDDIKTTDVSAHRIAAFASEEDFNGLSVELLIEVGSYACVAGNLLPAGTNRWNRNQAILGGHIVRLY